MLGAPQATIINFVQQNNEMKRYGLLETSRHQVNFDS